MTRARVCIEGFSAEEILALADADLAALVPIGRPIVFVAGSAELLGEIRVQGDRLIVQLAHIDGGGEGVLATITVLCQRYARMQGFTSIEWLVNAAHCAHPNDKLRRVLERRGYVVAALPERGEVYRLVEDLAGEVLTRDRMFWPLLRALSAFEPRWRALSAEWAEAVDGVPCYVALGELARHLVELLAAGRDADLRAAFAVVERWHVAGDAYVREAATVGLLENLQNGHLHERTDPEQFRRHLGPESARWWDKVMRFWRDGRILADDNDGEVQ